MTSYAPIDSRSPRGVHSPLQSPSYAQSASGSSQGENGNNPFLHSQQDPSLQRHMNGGSGASSVGGREFGPYSPLNRRANASNSYDDDHRSLNSSAERLVGPEGTVQGAALSSGAPHMVDMRGPEADDYLVSGRFAL